MTSQNNEQSEQKQISKEDYKELVLKKCESNHIWINKRTYLFPSDDQKIQLADMILEKLKNKSTQIPSEAITSESELMRELAELTPILYLKVNWS